MYFFQLDVSPKELFFRLGPHCCYCTSPACGGDVQESPRINSDMEIHHRIGVFTHHSYSIPFLLQSCIFLSIPALFRGCPSPRSSWLLHPHSWEVSSQSSSPALPLLCLLLFLWDGRKEKLVLAEGEESSSSSSTCFSLTGSFQSHCQELEVSKALPK